jgi:hypothetical protein
MTLRTGCGEVRFALMAVRSNGGAGGNARIGSEMLGFALLLVTCPRVVPAFRTQTDTRYPALAVVGVHTNVLLVLHGWTTVQSIPSKTHHLY